MKYRHTAVHLYTNVYSHIALGWKNRVNRRPPRGKRLSHPVGNSRPLAATGFIAVLYRIQLETTHSSCGILPAVNHRRFDARRLRAADRRISAGETLIGLGWKYIGAWLEGDVGSGGETVAPGWKPTSHPVGRHSRTRLKKVAPGWKLSGGNCLLLNSLHKTKVLKDCFKETLFIVISDDNIMPRSTAPKNLHGNLALMPVVPVVAVDLIRFEKNLLQMGFFGANDTRHSVQSSRRIEQLVTRNGQRIKVAAEFRGSHELGLPSTSDRDKYIAFTKIAMEQKLGDGRD